MTATTDSPTERETYAGTVARLAGAQKPKHGPPYTVHVNRRFGRRIAAAAHLLGLTPNQVTVVSTAITFTGIAVLAIGSSGPLTALAVSLLLAIGFAFDAADGQLARLGRGGSMAGEWLDHMVDSVKIVALHAAVAVHLYRATDLDHAWLLVPLGYAAVNVGSFFAQILSEQLQRNARTAGTAAVAPAVAVQPASLLRNLTMLPADYGTLCWIFVLLVAPVTFLVAYTALATAAAAHLAIAGLRRFRELTALDELARR